MINCQFCNKVFKEGGIGTHQAYCKSNPNKKSVSPNHGGYRKGSGRGIKGWYNGIFCDSSWELAYILYCEKHDITIKRYDGEKLPYISIDGEIHEYLPDFIVDNNIVIEIKGYETDVTDMKRFQYPDVVVLTKVEMAEILSQVKSIYGDDFISLYNNQKPIKKERKLLKVKSPKPKAIRKPKTVYTIECKQCKIIFERDSEHKEQIYCSPECSQKYHQKFDITPEELLELVWKYPTSTVSKMFGVSDKAIEKRCKKFGIEKPKRGYWSNIKD